MGAQLQFLVEEDLSSMYTKYLTKGLLTRTWLQGSRAAVEARQQKRSPGQKIGCAIEFAFGLQAGLVSCASL